MAIWASDARPAWQADALCAQTDPEVFFPEKSGSTREAKKVCAACPVRAECLEWAMTTGERHGVWGGLSEQERRKLKKTRTPARYCENGCGKQVTGQKRLCPQCRKDRRSRTQANYQARKRAA